MKMHGCGREGRFGRGGFAKAAMLFAGRGGFGRDGDFGRDGPYGPGGPFGGDGPFGRNGPYGRGGRGRGRVFGSGELRLVLLALVAEQPRHGYELIKAIEELTGGNYAPSPGVVYPTLSLLTDEGMIEEAAGEGSRKAYAATEAGRTELDGRTDEFAALVERLKGLADREDRHGAPPIRRAMGNLFAAVRNRAMEDQFDRETMHQIAEILDEAARKVERL